MVWTGKQFIEHALDIEAIEFTLKGRALKSGRTSPYFFHASKFSSGQDLAILSEAFKGIIMEHFANVEVVYGPPYKGTIIAPTIAFDIWRQPAKKVSFASHRKEVKEHGEGGTHIGQPVKGKAVVFVDDVITSGGSLDESVKRVRDTGGYPAGCVIAFDRQERDDIDTSHSASQMFSKKHDLKVFSIATFQDLVEVLQTRKVQSKNHDAQLSALLDYRSKYGIH
jgi:orotate phosphoribosyltransferase